MTIDHDSFGDYLKTERKLRNISLEEIAAATKIRCDYLKAIENDHFLELPNETFVKGYIRAYAKYCGMNEDEVLVNYEFFEQLNNTDVDTIELTEKHFIFQQKWIIYSFIITLIIIVCIICFFSFGPQLH